MHHSSHIELYEKLREKLNKAPIGLPKTASGVEKEILSVLFNEEEASIALHTPFIRFTPEMLAERTGKSVDYVKKILDEMARKGTVWKGEEEGKVYYRLLPVVVGFAEAPFYPGQGKDPRQEKLAPLWVKYWKEGFLYELGDRRHAIVRAIPWRGTISKQSVILPYDDAERLVRDRDYHAIAYCPCRIISRMVGNGCRRSLEVCLHFGSYAKYLVEHGFARRISVEEAVEVLRKCNREGLVHISERSRGPISTLCNCCGDCCVFFRSAHETKNPSAIAHSNYIANVDPSKCIACGICVTRCPMRAVRVKINKEPASIDVQRCLGCGVCVPTCPVEAIELIKRSEVVEWPDRTTYIQELLADRGKDISGLL
ncbi:MAG: 4Fe-4S binding protein [Candidatus Nezhaarchaeota archaeon]|nr:4Fe-4S binding protein [Candidatus Nezhaarchaeota archaeon]MCX8142591.1 4Fe-4S binding protein [Candidatus Nezhaarchaeota archaeon]